MVDDMRTNRRTCSCSFILDKTDTNCEKSNQTKSGALLCLAALTSGHPQSFSGKFFEAQKRESDVQQLTDRARPTLLSTQPSCFPLLLPTFTFFTSSWRGQAMASQIFSAFFFHNTATDSCYLFSAEERYHLKSLCLKSELSCNMFQCCFSTASLISRSLGRRRRRRMRGYW